MAVEYLKTSVTGRELNFKFNLITFNSLMWLVAIVLDSVVIEAVKLLNPFLVSIELKRGRQQKIE